MSSVDVLIAGAGPSGTALAIDLARRGVSVRIVDKAPHSFQGSRAKGLQPRTLEVLEDLGAIDGVLRGGCEYPLVGFHLGPLTVPWRMFQSRAPSPSVPYPNTWLIPQFVTDELLHARLCELGVEVEYCKELVGFTQQAERLGAHVQGPNGIEEIGARYLVGADGGASKVRATLGIEFAGTTREQDRILIVDAVVTGLSRDRWHMWPGRGGRFIAACPLPHTELFQWMVRLAPKEEPPRDLLEISTRIQAQIRAPRVELRSLQWRSVFRPNIRLAARYRDGRVFLVGDAAHVHTPAGAQGLNTGIQDAYNLGWKLAQVLAGADEALLDSYEAERRPIAASVLGLSTKKYDGLGKLDRSSMRRGKDEQQLGITYFGGPLAPTGAERTTSLRVGDRAPDALLADASGNDVRLFERLRGPHFTAVAYGARAHAALRELVWPTRGVSLERVMIDGPADALEDRARTFQRAYGVRDDALFIIRPDGYLGHIARHDLRRADVCTKSMVPSVGNGPASAT